MSTPDNSQTRHYFSDEIREALYTTIFGRRDVRGQFKPDPIPDDVLSRILYAAHHAPSVGYMQPWSFIVIKSDDVKQKIHQGFLKANAEAAEMFDDEKRQKYTKLKLEGILDSPVNICLTCDRERRGDVVLGRTAIPTMDLYSCVCAVQNLWLAARSEGVGLGWVSIIDEDEMKDILNIPERIVPIAYLCLGYVTHFNKTPELESKGWLNRLPLDKLLFFDQWDQRSADGSDTLLDQIRNDADFAARILNRPGPLIHTCVLQKLPSLVRRGGLPAGRGGACRNPLRRCVTPPLNKRRSNAKLQHRLRRKTTLTY